jgi:hypothetical protein
VYSGDVGSPEHDTAPIDLATGRPGSFRRREVRPVPEETPDPDAPRTKADRTGSALVRGFVDTILVTAKKEKPTEGDLRKLNADVTALAMLAGKGLAAVGSGGGGGRGGILVSAVVAAAVALGVPTVTGTHDALAEAIVNRMDTVDKRSDQHDQRLGALEAGQAKLRITLGKSIEWWGQEQYKSCTDAREIARGMNWIAEALPRGRDQGEYTPIVVDCVQYPRLPEDMEDLRTDARRADNARK